MTSCLRNGFCGGYRQLPTAQFDSIVVAGTVEAALAREGESRALAEAAALRRESDSAWHQLRERQEALQSLEVRDTLQCFTPDANSYVVP